MKKILGLDLGTNSIGWSVINAETVVEKSKFNGEERTRTYLKPVGISCSGSRIIPMDAGLLGDFEKGNSVSQTHDRTEKRGVRRMLERFLGRRERLLRVLKIMGFLPEHFSREIDEYGKFRKGTEPKLAWQTESDGKSVFLFSDAYAEMKGEFLSKHPDLKSVPQDWTVYYLRKKALTEKISKQELAWVIMQANQKRGYYQRGMDEEIAGKKVEYLELKVQKVEDSGEKDNKGVPIYNVVFENSWVYQKTSSVLIDWAGKTIGLIVTTEIDENGNAKLDKSGKVKRTFKVPQEEDWTLIKKRTESVIKESGKTVGAYIYDELLENPSLKIIGKFVATIDRGFYRTEFERILEKQSEFHPELKDMSLYDKCINALYRSNEDHKRNIAGRGFTYLFINDILFYHRPLKSKKSLIADCPYETRKFVDKETGEEKTVKLKCIAKSHPLFQEFRLWQFIYNLKIFEKNRVVDGKIVVDADVTAEFLKSADDYVRLFEFLNGKEKIKKDTILGYKPFNLGKNKSLYSWNYPEDKVYPGNDTRCVLQTRLKAAGLSEAFLTEERFAALWHILYSVSDPQEIKKALKKFAVKNDVDDAEAFVEELSKVSFDREYGSYSEKAIKKLLSVMRPANLWSEEFIDKRTKSRIENILAGNFDDTVPDRVRDKLMERGSLADFSGLPLWLACYVVYGIHSESKELEMKWNSPDDIDAFLQGFKQHSLRNPIVEQVVLETLRTVRDIWKQEGRIDEIHLEMAREMKKTAEERKKLSDIISENENTNLRIKHILKELASPGMDVDDVRPYSPMHQEKFKIYEQYVLEGVKKGDDDFEYVQKIKKNTAPSRSDVVRYKCWLEQKYRSPYTGKVIPLSKLFTAAYEIEHVIPQSLYYDDSFSNKVICESAVNKEKSNKLAMPFIKEFGGKVVNGITVWTVKEYEEFVKEHYSNNKVKMRKLLMEEIPDGFNERQLNDSRYISRFVMGLLSNIVRECDENGNVTEHEAVSKNLVICTGGVTDRLKQDWGINDKWNEIILPRFMRMNDITKTNDYVSLNKSGHPIPSVPLDNQKNFNKKRIDHRHHAMDAIVIACATRSHINLLNNVNAQSENERKDLKAKLTAAKGVMKLPWDTFPADVLNSLKNIVVSFRQNLRVINKTSNWYCHFDENGKKCMVKQEKGDSWAIRKSMHKDTVFGEINIRMRKNVRLKDALQNLDMVVDKDLKKQLKKLVQNGCDEKKIVKFFDDNKDAWQDVDLNKISVYYFSKDTKDRYFSTRKPLSKEFNSDKIEKQVADSGIKKILLAHLEASGGDAEVAFSPEGVEEMNKNIVELNNGKFHHPIYKVCVYEKAEKFAVGQTGNKSKKFVEADKGTNLFFMVCEKDVIDKKTNEVSVKRCYGTLPLKLVIDCQKMFEKNWQSELLNIAKNVGLIDKEARLLFILSPGDLVARPAADGSSAVSNDRIYKMVSATGTECYFVPNSLATVIVKNVELLSLNKMERAISGEMIKEVCVPIQIDRLGNYDLKKI